MKSGVFAIITVVLLAAIFSCKSNTPTSPPPVDAPSNTATITGTNTPVQSKTVTLTVTFSPTITGTSTLTATPSITPSVTPTFTPSNLYVDDLEDGDLVPLLPGSNTWAYGATAGSSVTGTFISGAGTYANAGSYCAGLTGTVQASINGGVNWYGNVSITVYCRDNSAPLDLVTRGQNTLRFMINTYYFVGCTGTSTYQVRLYNASGQYAYMDVPYYNDWIMHTDSLSSFTPGGAYTLNNVLSGVVRIVWVLQYTSTTQNELCALAVFLDNIYFYFQ